MLETVVILLAVLVFIAGLAAIAVVMDRIDDRKKLSAPKASPHELLDIRLAKGEIGEAEYLRLKHVLTYGPLLDVPDELRSSPEFPVA